MQPAVALPRRADFTEDRVNGVKFVICASEGLGGAERGISLPPAPARSDRARDGWVVYAGSFRSYGQLLILMPRRVSCRSRGDGTGIRRPRAVRADREPLL